MYAGQVVDYTVELHGFDIYNYIMHLAKSVLLRVRMRETCCVIKWSFKAKLVTIISTVLAV